MTMMIRWSRLFRAPGTQRASSFPLSYTSISRPFSISLLPPGRHNNESKRRESPSSVSILPSGSRSGDIVGLNLETTSKHKETTRGRPKVAKERKRSKQSGRKGKGSSKKKKRKPQALDITRTHEQRLQDWYEEQHGVAFKDKCIVMMKVSIKGFTGWKAQFTCPITKETFICGTTVGSDDLICSEAGDDVVYYKSRDARHAAMARALDCFKYRNNERSVHHRRCVEMPYRVGEDPIVAMPEEADLLESEEEGEEQISDEAEASDGVASDDDDDEEDDEDEDEDEEYTIQFLSGTSANANAADNPLARVIGSWNNKATSFQSKPDTDLPLLSSHPQVELTQLLENAKDWIQKEQENKLEWSRDQHRVMLQAGDFPRSLEIANTILEGLARAHSRLPFQAKPRGIEQVATKILNHLWSTTTAHPNASTYAAYLGCLEGPDPLTVAKSGKEILDGMKEGAAVDVAGVKRMPKPTIEVVNAVIQLWAQVGGETGKSLDLGVVDQKANKETFLSLLSSMSYPPSVEGETGGFDPIYAEECISKMKAAGFSADTSAHNAGLRWSGGMQSTLSRPYMRPIPWDAHPAIFQGGFLPFDEDSAKIQEAYKMHAWLEEMASEDEAASPNIETHEAVIQAYVRTGTLDGVEQAEVLLESLLDSKAAGMPAPRLQTFHPIIAAWAHSGHDQSPQKVNKWIDRLLSISKAKIQSEDFERHVKEAPLLANANRLLKVLSSGKELSTTEFNDLVDTGLGIGIHLKDICSSTKDSNETNPLLDAQAFVLVAQVWGSLGIRFLQTESKSELIKQAFDQLYETVEEYERLISSLWKVNGCQAHTLASNSHKVYSVLLSTLQEAAALSGTDARDLMEEHIGRLERWVRRLDEFDSLHSNENKDSENRVYSDMYSYVAGSPLPSGCAEAEAEFLLQALEFLRNSVQDPTVSPRRGDMIRICFLILEKLPSAHRNSSAGSNMHGKRPFSLVSGYTEVIKTVCHLVKGPEERDALLGRILSQADWLLDKRMCSENDNELIVKEIRKQSSSMPARRPVRRRMIRRARFGHQQERRPVAHSEDGGTNVEAQAMQ